MVKNAGLELSPRQVKVYAEILERYCAAFMNSTIGEGSFALYNRFIATPVETCLTCHGHLNMHNAPSKAVVYEASGPFPATKITSECRKCETQHGICYFSNKRGKHLYPEEIQTHFIEASTVTYMDKSLYKWIPSLA